MRLRYFAAVPAFIVFAASCAAKDNVREQAIDHMLEMCKLLSEPGVDTKAEGEVWFWYQTERANASRQLWSPEGIRAIQARLTQKPEGRDEACLQRALRESQKGEIE